MPRRTGFSQGWPVGSMPNSSKNSRSNRWKAGHVRRDRRIGLARSEAAVDGRIEPGSVVVGHHRVEGRPVRLAIAEEQDRPPALGRGLDQRVGGIRPATGGGYRPGAPPARFRNSAQVAMRVSDHWKNPAAAWIRACTQRPGCSLRWTAAGRAGRSAGPGPELGPPSGACSGGSPNDMRKTAPPMPKTITTTSQQERRGHPAAAGCEEGPDQKELAQERRERREAGDGQERDDPQPARARLPAEQAADVVDPLARVEGQDVARGQEQGGLGQRMGRAVQQGGVEARRAEGRPEEEDAPCSRWTNRPACACNWPSGAGTPR